jgi:hypothetical protein
MEKRGAEFSMKRFTTKHAQGSHTAYLGDETVGPFPTEIELVRQLLCEGIDLKHYGFSSSGTGYSVVTVWTKGQPDG